LPNRIRECVKNLDSDSFRVRQVALKELAERADEVESLLRELLAGKLSAEQRQRLEQLVNEPESVRSAEELRALRAVELLERIGTPPAQELLRSLAAGPPVARLTREAQAALNRLANRPNSKS